MNDCPLEIDIDVVSRTSFIQMRFNEFLARILFQPSPSLVSMDDYLANKITKEELDQKTEL